MPFERVAFFNGIIPFNLVEMFAATLCPNYIAVAFRRRYFLPNDSSPFRRSRNLFTRRKGIITFFNILTRILYGNFCPA